MDRRTLAWLSLLLLATAAVRLPAIDRPLLGHFATRHIVNAMAARNWALGRATLFTPRLDCLRGGERAMHLVELPVSAYVAGGCWRVLGGSLDVWGRLVSIACSLAAVAILFLLVRRWHGDAPAWVAAVTLAFSPVSIIYGSGFMIEPVLVAFSLATLWCWAVWLEKTVRLEERRWLALAGAVVCFALAILTKVYMLVLLLPLGGMLAVAWASWPSAAHGWAARATILISLIALLVAILPAGAWLAHVWRLSDPTGPGAAHIYYSLRDSSEAHGFPHPLLTNSAFWGRVARDLAVVTLTPLGLALAAIGLVHRGARRHLFWLLSMAALVIVMPRKFHEMNYYYLVILPPLAVLAGLGWRTIAERWHLSWRGATATLLLGASVSLYVAAKPAFVTPAEDRAVLPVAEATQRLAQPDEPIATLHGTTLDLLYYCDRPGWVLSADKPLAEQIDTCRGEGARLLVVAGLERLSPAQRVVLGTLPTAAEGDDYLVVRLAE